MEKIWNYKVIFVNKNFNNPNIVFAMGRFVVHLETLNDFFSKQILLSIFSITLLEQNNRQKENGEVCFQIRILDEKIKDALFAKINKLINAVKKNYKIEQISVEKLEDPK